MPLVPSAGLQSATCLGIPSTSICVAKRTAVTNPMGHRVVHFALAGFTNTWSPTRCLFFKVVSLVTRELSCTSGLRQLYLKSIVAGTALLVPLKGAILYQKTMLRGFFPLRAACRLMVLWCHSIIPFPADLRAQQKTRRIFHFSHTCASCRERNVKLLSSNSSSGGPLSVNISSKRQRQRKLLPTEFDAKLPNGSDRNPRM